MDTKAGNYNFFTFLDISQYVNSVSFNIRVLAFLSIIFGCMTDTICIEENACLPYVFPEREGGLLA